MKCFELRLYGYVAIIFATAASQAFAQTGEYPSKPVRFVCVNAPGGGVDIVGRLVADRVTRNIHQLVIVENRAGAGGNIATEYVARAAPDG